MTALDAKRPRCSFGTMCTTTAMPTTYGYRPGTGGTDGARI